MTYVCAIHILLEAFGTSDMRGEEKEKHRGKKIANIKF